MAQRTVVEVTDDLTGGPAEETVTFAIGGVAYEIDLNTKNLEKFNKSIKPFVDAARRVGKVTTPKVKSGKGRATVSRDTETPVDPSAVRAWAAANQIEVSPRGRVPGAVVAQFREAGN